MVIKGFEMPESCDFCPMLHDDLGMCKLTNVSAQDMAKTAGQMWKYCPVCGVRIRYDRDNDDVSDVGVREYITEDEFERRYIGGSLRNRGDK